MTGCSVLLTLTILFILLHSQRNIAFSRLSGEYNREICLRDRFYHDTDKDSLLVPTWVPLSTFFNEALILAYKDCSNDSPNPFPKRVNQTFAFASNNSRPCPRMIQARLDAKTPFDKIQHLPD